MKMTDRDRLRRLQNKVINYLEKNHFNSDSNIAQYYNRHITLQNLRDYIYPELEDLFREILGGVKNES